MPWPVAPKPPREVEELEPEKEEGELLPAPLRFELNAVETEFDGRFVRSYDDEPEPQCQLPQLRELLRRHGSCCAGCGAVAPDAGATTACCDRQSARGGIR